MRFPPLQRRPRRWAILVPALLIIAPAAWAGTSTSADALDGDEPRLVARLLADPQGEGRWRVGVELVPDTGWHVYWRNPGDTGLSPRIDWHLAGGGESRGEVGPVAWPVPRAFRDGEADLLSYGYAEPVLLAALADVGGGGVSLEAKVDALVCAHVCIPGSFALETALDPARPRDPSTRARFDAAELRLPRPAAQRAVVTSLERVRGAPDARLRATLLVYPCGRGQRDGAPCEVGSSSAGGPAFFPYAGGGVEWVASPPRPHPSARDAFAVDLEGRLLEPLEPLEPGGERRLAGVVPLRDVAGRERSVEIALAVAARSPALSGAAGAWLRAALLGLLGGLLLNLMPCVLPVLAIKLHSLAALAQGSRREHHRHAAAYVAGIELSMLALAIAVLGLRAAGSAVGWGFQLQEPVFVAAISSLLVVFALNLFGVFEIQIDTSRLSRIGGDAPGAGRSFFDGLLAVALATPCSAPFLGTAVGFAFASPGPVIVSIFLAIGLGLASPFLLAALFPGWMRAVPRSGAWMADLRGGLGFALLATVLWLLWILGRAAGPHAITGALLLLLVLAAASWVVGLLQRRGRVLPATALAALLVAVAAGGIGVVDLEPRSAGPESPIAGTLPFAPAAVRSSVSAGRPVFVYFTADWCVTCKLNEKRVLADPRVSAELAHLGYDVFRGDWTRRDEKIRSALADLGKAGVPVYALYGPGRSGQRPTLLPVLLTVDGLLDALRETAAPTGAPS